ncbi:MAG: Fe-S assembly protein IscX [Bradymonadales bacterium]|nr:MAG: Fe-S assembly protein IscX [Bradymonadales bacterium]
MAKKTAKKLKWSDIGDIAFRLIDEHPRLDPSRLSVGSIEDMVLALADFGESSKQPTEELLQEIQERWAEERDEIADELEPIEEAEEEDLDEDRYREDRTADEKDEDDESEDETEPEFDEFEEDEDDDEEEF